jgi:UPF0755 protein
MSGFTTRTPTQQKPRYAPRRWLKALLLVVIILAIALLAAVVVLRRVYNANLRAVSTVTTTQQITIASGATTHDIATTLKKDGLIRETWAFEWYVRSNSLRDSLKAGTYDISPNQSINAIVDQIVKGKVSTRLMTILPAQRLDQIRKAFIDAGFSSASVDAALDPGQYKDEPALADKPTGATLEGYLYPDSFERTADTQPETIIRESLALMQKHLTPDVRAGFVKQGLTVHQGVVLASIVEREVSNASDRPIVAQVFLKRLQIGMTLGSDVTAYYGAIVAGHQPSVDYDSPYNTRIHAGLPPGPISNVTDSSLRAVAFPAATGYIYFVTGDDGVTHFSNTLAEHQAATQQYCKKLCSE